MAALSARLGTSGSTMSLAAHSVTPFRPALRCRRVARAAPLAARASAAETQQQRSAAAAPQQQQQQQQAQQQGWPSAGASAAWLAAAAALVACGPAAAGGLGDLDAGTAHSIENVLRPLFFVFTILYIIRIPMTWYPSIDGTKLPWLVAYAPTEPILKVTRQVIPLVGGVDISPIVWVALISFFNEILLGPQGILILIQRQSGAGL